MLTGGVLRGGLGVVEDATGGAGTVDDVVVAGVVDLLDDLALEHPAAVKAVKRLAAIRNALRRMF